VLDCMGQALLYVYFEDKTRQLFKLSLRGAQEAIVLVRNLETVCVPFDETQVLTTTQKTAKATLQAIASTLGISEAATYSTLNQVAQDPYAQFISKVWY
jgi:hypothetical protein